ncbi:MAG: HAMP domain-containing histidine kinase, partial [Myxococcales bacterium]|nr:HAMP domain-containing histidine kinase [Myxococcales bacterium]
MANSRAGISDEVDLLTSQKHIEQLSEEVLDLYRQVNLLYRLGDVFNAGLEREEICRLLIKESCKVLRARTGRVVLDDGFALGRPVDEARSSLTVAIETLAGHIGEITLYEKRSGFFTAADEKLVRAVARQAGVALENSRRIAGLIEQNEALGRLNGELRAIARMKSDFVSNVSHELRTPLASIKGFAATILDDPEMPLDVIREFVGIIDAESDKLVVIIGDLLDVSKMLSGHLAYQLAPAPLEEVVAEVVALMKIQAQGKGLSLQSVVEAPARVLIDRTRIWQVLTNLVGNAVKFTDAGGVTIRQYLDGDRVCVAVSDTGIGIRNDLLPHIFDRFYRVENVVHTKEGTGLGLALVRGIVDYHRG